MNELEIKNLLENFERTDKSDWIKKLSSELKGRTVEDLIYSIEDGIKIDPLIHRDEIQKAKNPIETNKSRNQWEIGTKWTFDTELKTNIAIHKGLDLGVGAVEIYFSDFSGIPDFESLFDQIRWDFIELHLSWKGSNSETNEFLDNLYSFIASRDIQQAKLFLHCPILANNPKEFRHKFANFKDSRIKYLKLKSTASNSAIEELTQVCDQLITIAESTKKDKELLQKMIESCYFELSIRSNFILEIAKLRAIKILWANILKAFKLDFNCCYIKALVQENTNGMEPNQRLISQASASASAVIGGVDSLFIDVVKAKDDLYRELAIKMQHILKMESHLDQVIDPAAGSYFIEKLTDQLVMQVWKNISN